MIDIFVDQQVANILEFTTLFVFIIWIMLMIEEYWKIKYGKSFLDVGYPEEGGDENNRRENRERASHR